MSLDPQLVPIPFSGGLDTKTDPAQVLAGKLLALENGQFTRGGQITKRFGYDTLSTSVEGGGAVQAAQAIASHEDELLLFDGKHVYSHVEATGNWLNRGNAVSIIATDNTIVRITGAQQLNPDVAILKGIEVYAWEDSGGGVRYSVVDATTRAFAVSNALVDVAGVQPKVIAFAGKIVILFSNGTESLYYRTINPLNPTLLGTKTTIFTDGFAAFGYDVAVIGAKLAIGYLSSSTVTGAIQLMTLDQTLAVNPAAPVIVENTVNKAITGGKLSVLSVVGDSVQNIWIGWATGADVRVAVYTYNLVAVLADTVVDASAESLALTMVESPTTALKMQIVYEVKAAATYNHLSKLKTTTSGGTVATVGTLRSVGLAAKAFTQDGQSYATFAHESPLQSTYFTAELSSTFPIVAKIGADVGGGLRTNGMLSECSLADTGTWLWANLTKGKIITEANTLFALLGVSSTRFDFAHPNRFLAATSARQLLFVGGILQSYDGSAAVEHGFHLDPADPPLRHEQARHRFCHGNESRHAYDLDASAHGKEQRRHRDLSDRGQRRDLSSHHLAARLGLALERPDQRYRDLHRQARRRRHRGGRAALHDGGCARQRGAARMLAHLALSGARDCRRARRSEPSLVLEESFRQHELQHDSRRVLSFAHAWVRPARRRHHGARVDG
jgi:hypothetical protein